MLFNSIDFAIFLPIVFVLYWYLNEKGLKFQNLFVVLASYLFYGWWDWHFLTLILFSTVVDYSIGLHLDKEKRESKRKMLLWLSLLINLGLLGFFKYYNFFIENFTQVFTFLGSPIQSNTLNIILPVGISFYTFQTLSYTIDIYRKKLKPTADFISFAAFVSFFPQLVAGPIERASHLLPQFQKRRVFEYQKAVDGLRQILWGLFKKMVIADNAAILVNQVFDNSDHLTGSNLLTGAIFFSFQIYGDFSGYSDIAIGTARLFGFDLSKNFAFPYFSRDMAEFWRRWHISLSTWFRDYIYIPLGGSRGSKWIKMRNVMVIFLVSGFWHGANWTFIVWGFIHALLFLPLLFFKQNRKNMDSPNFRDIIKIGVTFGITTLAWIFFRAENIQQAYHFITHIFTKDLFTFPNFTNSKQINYISMLIIFFIVVEWIGKEGNFALEQIGLAWKRPFRWLFYSFLVFLIGMFMVTEETPFIYFQF